MVFVAGFTIGLLFGLVFMFVCTYSAMGSVKAEAMKRVVTLDAALQREREAGGRLEIKVSYPRGNVRYLSFVSLSRPDALEALRRASMLHKTGQCFSTRSMQRVLSRRQFELFRDELMERGFLDWAGDSVHNGLEWTLEGEQLLNVLGNETH